MNDTTFVTETICGERMKRLEERVDKIETLQQEIHTLSLSVERLAMTIKNMVDTQKSQEERIETIEGRDAKMWQDVVRTAVTGVIGIIIGYALRQLGIF